MQGIFLFLTASPSGRGQARSEAQRQERVACMADESASCLMSPVRARMMRNHQREAFAKLERTIRARFSDFCDTEKIPYAETWYKIKQSCERASMREINDALASTF